MAVRVCFRVPRQLQFRHDSSNHVLVSENAAVGKERESLGLCVVHDATGWELFVFRFSGNLAAQPPLFPNVDVAPRMGQVISVWLCFAERRAVDKRLAINEPKDTHSRLSRPCGCLALSAFMRFLHWLMFAADRSDVGGIFRAGALSQSSCNLPLYLPTAPSPPQSLLPPSLTHSRLYQDRRTCGGLPRPGRHSYPRNRTLAPPSVRTEA